MGGISAGPSRVRFPGGLVKNLTAMRETWLRSLSWEDTLEEGVVIHSCILAWRIPMDRGIWWATVHGVAKSRTGLSDQAQHIQECSSVLGSGAFAIGAVSSLENWVI